MTITIPASSRSAARLLVLASLLSVLAAQCPAQSIFASAAKRSPHRGLIDDLSARKIGDILTVVIREQHRVKNEDKVGRTSNSSLAASLESFDIKANAFTNGILPSLDVRTSKAQNGNAKQEKDATFEAQIAVTIVDELPNGNLVVSGRRTVLIDDETKTLKISGVIRRWDIDANNQVSSNRVAEAMVAIEGVGKNTEHVTKGPVAKVIETALWLIWPF
ncbi:MAG TPA: flagellar basal body L-ring protein FlgH [Planctomycetota bacterium]|nr:flagellar basal body L-ring protein FlgH [Planctomycetota bacterium]